ncbi:MAG: DUF1559 domain-containing protein [Planctomycetes bacterium]|nr:DUF1559 domain-containing protein [Planctomycetota bacterium]
MRQRAFTLIELLVVVTIIALLIAILLPSLRQAQITARRVACASNLRQIRIATEMYISDYKQSLPGPTTSGQFPGYSSTFYVLSGYLAPYLGKKPVSSVMQMNDVFICPGFARVAPPNVDPTVWVTYVADGLDKHGKRLLGYPPGPSAAPPEKVTDVYRPDSTAMMQEIDELTHPGGWGGKVALEPMHDYFNGLPVRNYLYFDGHVDAHIGF